jgi:hypothetical protein
MLHFHPTLAAAGPFLFCLAVAAPLAAEEAMRPTLLSSRLNAEIRTSLPAYTPSPAKPKNTPAEAAQPDPDVVVLPKMTVREKRAPRFDPLDLMSPKERAKKYAAEYRNSLKGLDAVLNGFSIPFFGPSLAALGRELHIRRQFEDLHFVSTVGDTLDPKASAVTKKAEAEMKRAIEWQNRPAGD